MSQTAMIERLASLPGLDELPREELKWLVTHGELETYESGAVIGPKGQRIETIWIVLSGSIAIRVDRGVGPRRVAEWHPGDISGKLPYSRMSGPPGDNYVIGKTECLEIHERHFPELIRNCPVFTAKTVHIMLDRARSFNASDLQDEKLISLGRLAAGLAHELNNPASATVRGAKLLLAGLDSADAASRALGAAGLTSQQLEAIERLRSACMATPARIGLSPIELADRQDEITDWLERHDVDAASAESLAETPATIEELDRLADAIPAAALDAAVRWIAVGCTMHALAADIDHTATRIHELVAAVRRFTYMDNPAGPVSVAVEDGLRDTIRVVAAKARAKNATITLDAEAGLPRVMANGGELNQIWLNLLDNALDAIDESGHIAVEAHREVDRVVVTVTDDGVGIPEEVQPRIFEPFFTTKPPGQGTGLGLDITRRLVTRYHGEIAVESRPGRTQFRVSLVAEQPVPAAG